MLDLLPGEIWSPHPSPTFFEPACGDGNFLVAIFDRKAKVVAEALHNGDLHAGADRAAFLFHLLEALSSIYGVDISVDNIDGTSDHPLGARERMVLHFQRAVKRTLGRRLPETDRVLRAARWIAWRNVRVGNMLPSVGGSGDPKCPQVQLLEYEWNATARDVDIRSTALADVMTAAQSQTNNMLTLFPPPESTLVWSGKASGSMSSRAGP